MTITKKKMKSGIKYYVQVCVNGQRPSASFDTLSEAARWEEGTRARLKGGDQAPVEPGRVDMLFKDAADQFIVESRGVKSAGQIKNYEWAQKQLLKSFGEAARLSTITPQDVNAHMLRRINIDGVGPSIIRLELSVIRMVYASAAAHGFTVLSPELSIKRPRPKIKGREEALGRVIRPEELQAILAEAHKRKSNLVAFLTFLLYTGMRPSEAASLYLHRLPAREEKEAVKNKLPVGFVDLGRGGFSKVGTKTEQRFIPAHPVVVDLLAALPKGTNRLVFLDDKYIVKDRPYLYYRRPMKTTLDNAQLRGGIDFYSFRHTARSAMANCGIPFEVSEAIIGHSGHGREVAKIYIHLSDDDLVREIAKLEYPGL